MQTIYDIHLGIKNDTRTCCKALTASCDACNKDMSVEAYCDLYPRAYDCPSIVNVKSDDNASLNDHNDSLNAYLRWTYALKNMRNLMHKHVND